MSFEPDRVLENIDAQVAPININSYLQYGVNAR